MKEIEPRYLGDGVYASYDGYHINLTVNDYRNHAISLDPEVMEALKDYEEYIIERLIIKKNEPGN